jgi:hypothetical protein
VNETLPRPAQNYFCERKRTSACAKIGEDTRAFRRIQRPARTFTAYWRLDPVYS